LAYVLYQRGQVRVGRVQHSGLIRPFETGKEKKGRKARLIERDRYTIYQRIPYAPVGTLRESGFESVGAGTLDHVDERPGVENDLLECGGASHSNFRRGQTVGK
jgi:hypothetical protein